MYLDHEGNRKGDKSPSWGQPNTRVHIRTIETLCTPRSRGGGRHEYSFHASQKHEDPGRGKKVCMLEEEEVEEYLHTLY